MIEVNAETTPYLFIDGSYFCFYCYYSLERWWKIAFSKDPESLSVLDDPVKNPLFVEKFKEKCRKMIETLPKNLHMDQIMDLTKETPRIYIGKDCKREKIWRNALFPGYKAQRADHLASRKFNGGPLFALAYNELFSSLEFQKLGVCGVLADDCLEADDCIALSVMNLHSQYPEQSIYIVTSDRDYLQLVVSPHIYLYDLSYRKLTEIKGSSGNAECDLFCKIVMGDKSDNIPPIFQKCGPKTALKYFHDKKIFEERMKKENAYEKFALNEKIISFQHLIPFWQTFCASNYSSLLSMNLL